MCIDYMLSCQVYKYLLVVSFQSVLRHFSASREDAKSVVKCLMKELIPRFGIPLSINTDKGSAFVAKNLASVLDFHWG